ncbi:ATP-binding protein [Bacillus sp. 31A1R]|uniref:histidine kinase n=1 Tax=Robertmurraya mangrovi TaxID=3098077 RepID=A0ABU5J0P6_9BACI|nr:ATP-binding protein [Bacillus sp. 31A1R]MDZ5472974.1 ATP-binding protein [Bacillus sp. 31A1R]
MLVEKLLLHVLITVAPILLYNFFIENKNIKIKSAICGLLQGIAASLCMIFPVDVFGLSWDLRYIPLVMAFLYSGPVAGGIVFASIVITRTFIGGETLPLGYISAVVAVIVPLYYSKRFLGFNVENRVRLAVLIGLWPGLVQLGILCTWVYFVGTAMNRGLEMLFYIVIFGFINLACIGLVAKLSEMTIERQMLKEEVRRAEKFNTLGELAASIAHEVRNPLTVVKGFLQLMHQKEQGQNRDYLTLVLSELGRAESIITDYLNFAKPQFEKVENFSLKDLILDVHQLIEPLANQQGVELKCTIQSEVHLFADRNQIKQALVNIIKNAIEASEQSGLITITLSKEDEFVHISIQDNGKGMTEDQLQRIGTLFYTTKDKGTGLGTMVSLKIIESLQGKMTYDSKEGVGTTVSIVLPVLKNIQVY